MWAPKNGIVDFQSQDDAVCSKEERSQALLLRVLLREAERSGAQSQGPSPESTGRIGLGCLFYERILFEPYFLLHNYL